MEKLTFKVAEYEGPLDLLLHLIQKHQMNIYEIEISSLLTQYMEYIHQWQSHNLEVASEFLDMASRLIHLKTISLLPKHEEEEQKERAAQQPTEKKRKIIREGSTCPVCGEGKVIKGKTAYGCSRWKEGCDFRKPFK